MSSARRVRLHTGAAAAALLLAAACGRAAPQTAPRIALVTPTDSTSVPYIEVTGLSRSERSALGSRSIDRDGWSQILFVAVSQTGRSADRIAVAGTHAIVGDALRFTPMFPFDPGRRYDVEFNAGAIPGGDAARRVSQTITLPAGPEKPPTRVTGIFPSGDVLPENQLRLYVHFSAPMGRRGGLEYVSLLDDKGREVPDPFLPLDAEFWNADRTRYTVFFDPGRQKRGILPNRQMGPSLVAGRTYTLVVRQEWTDGNGRPLATTFEHRFRVGPPALNAIDLKTWTVTPPAEGTRDPIVVTFPEPLDHGLLHRALGVRRDGEAVVGEIRVGDHERRWTMTPERPWQPGRYEMIALSILEDRAGNRIGRPFEVDGFRRAAESAEPAVSTIPLTLGRGR